MLKKNHFLSMINDKKSFVRLYQEIFDIVYKGIVVVDEDGIIQLITNGYCQFLGVEQEEAVGKHVTEVIENTRMHIVAKKGQQEIGDIQQIKGNKMISDRHPLYIDGKLVGAVGVTVFRDVGDLDAYVRKVGRIEKELDYYKKELMKVLGSAATFDEIAGKSSSLQQALSLAKKVAYTNSNVLLLGESGTGKGLFASAIHNASARREYPLIKVNCAAIPAELLESELFGYEGGAFTGAKKSGKPGKFEIAQKSTIFLDEIGDLPLTMQAKLLKVIQDREIERLGGTDSIEIDTRIIAATNRNLEEMIKDKTFREDLYYRLNVISIYIPALRERVEDIPDLTRYLVHKISEKMDRHHIEISPQVMDCLSDYHWPGNVREMENIIERAFNLLENDRCIMMKHLPSYLMQSVSRTASHSGSGLREILDEVEKSVIEKCLMETMGNKYQAAKILGISRTSLYEKIARYQIKCK